MLDWVYELPSVENLLCILQKCRKKKSLAHAKRVRAHICNIGLEAQRAVGNHIVPMFVDCGSVSDAQQVFDRLVHKNEHSWTSLILGYIQGGKTQHAVNLYQKMQENSVHPSMYTLMAILKACARLKDLERGRETHVQIAQDGFDKDLFVGNALIDMYAKCGSLSESWRVFDRLPSRDVVSWSALIAGYAEHGHCWEAVKCFEQMQLEGLSPDGVMFVCALKACGSIGAIGKGRELHAEIVQRGFEGDLLVGNTLVYVYAKCGSLSEAQGVFDKLSIQDVVSWNALIAGYSEHGGGGGALKRFEQMQMEGVSPDAVTFVCALQASGCCGICKGREMHVEIVENGFGRDLIVCSTLVNMYAKCGSPSEAQEVFDKLPTRDIVSWSALIAGYADHGPGQEALKCFEEMQQEGISPNSVLFVSVLKACGSMGAISKGREIYSEISQKGLESDIFVGIALVQMFAKSGSLSEAREIFHKLPVRDAVLWNALIAGYVEHAPAEEVMKCFKQMQLEGISPMAITLLCILKACGNAGDIGKGREIHAEVAQKGFERDHFVFCTLIDMYAQSDSLAEAWEVFNSLPFQSVVSWNALIAGYAAHGPGQEAIRCLEEMQFQGISPNVVTFVCVLKACGSIGAAGKGREIHAEIARNGLERDLYVCSTLIDMYAKCGSLSEAEEVFDMLLVRDVVSWNAMIRGYGMNNEGNFAVQCFEDMQKQGVKPDIVTFTCLFSACSRTKLVFKGQEYFKAMREECGIAPTTDHYAGMVDILARAGNLYEAENFLQTMQCLPSEETLTSLLSACKTYGEAELGLRCFQQLVVMHADSAASYALMANIYANAARWGDAYAIEGMRKHAGAKKKPANALIEMNNTVHEFVVGNNEGKDISAMLDILSARLKGDGYVPNLDLVVRLGSYPIKRISMM